MIIRLLIILIVFSTNIAAEDFLSLKDLKALPELAGWQTDLSPNHLVYHHRPLSAPKQKLNYEVHTDELTSELSKILWFSAFLKGANLMDVSFSLSWDEVVPVPGRLRRILHPNKNSAIVYPDNQIYRELVDLKIKNFKKNYTFLNIRMNNGELDASWVYSPFVKSVRKLTGTNRADNLLGSTFALDDFFAWSGSYAMQEVIAETQVNVPVPFALGTGKSFKQRNCQIVKLPAEDSLKVTLNKQFLKKVVVLNKDFYSPVKRQVIYFNESGIPIFRFVYDRLDKPKKFLLNLVSTEDLIYETLVFQGNQITRMKYQSYNYCREVAPEKIYRNFDPAEL